MAATTFDPCGALEQLQGLQVRAINALFARFAALQRLAQILADVGDVSGFLNALLNSVGRLVPLGLVDVTAYNQLRAACPFLGLPAITTDGLDQLITDLAIAYADLLRQIDLHPFARLDGLQSRLNSALATALNAFNNDWYLCAQAICDVATGETEILRIAEFKTKIALAADPAEAFSVIGEAGVDKANQIKTARAEVLSLVDFESDVYLSLPATVQNEFSRFTGSFTTTA